MAKVKVSDLQSGWVLAEDVHDLNGRFLMGKDCELTEKHIRALRAWGVNSIQVSGDDIPESGSAVEIPEDLLTAVQTEQEKRFAHADMQDDFTKELLHQSILYIARSRFGK